MILIQRCESILYHYRIAWHTARGCHSDHRQRECELYSWQCDAHAQAKTLRFVQSLPKREKVPFTTKFHNADALGECSARLSRVFS